MKHLTISLLCWGLYGCIDLPDAVVVDAGGAGGQGGVAGMGGQGGVAGMGGQGGVAGMGGQGGVAGMGGQGGVAGMGGQGGVAGMGGQGGGGGMGEARCDAPAWSLLERWAELERIVTPTVKDIDADGYLDVVLATAVDGAGQVRVGYGGPTGLACDESWPTLGRPWRATVGQFGMPTLVTLERDPDQSWHARAYVRGDQTPIWDYLMSALPEQPSPNRPLLMLATPLDATAGDELLFGSLEYLLSAAEPGAAVDIYDPRPVRMGVYEAQALRPLGDGRVLMIEDSRARIFGWASEINELNGGLPAEYNPNDVYRAVSNPIDIDGGRQLAAGYNLTEPNRLFDLLTVPEGGAVDTIQRRGYAPDDLPFGLLVHSLALGDLRGIGAVDVALLEQDVDEWYLRGCTEPTDGRCRAWSAPQRVLSPPDDGMPEPPTMQFIHGDFDTPLGQASPHEMLLVRTGQPLECWHMLQQNGRTVFARCETE